eukprot:CAMPEP_0203755510 /NCGR_PEP_ID=MMETSP0098-20131031/8945_1 /ASSEMBLY_ACC=CAM_ASM_000208 /TAXON_ID=96639 /ORGANISM=" , Strain NY0313808BC1" /LENGTH=247 /DNA_ID=CAMNT_0050646999 /DNA_START=104 /DNA_END=844 /DNA_ORIENTATION=+
MAEDECAYVVLEERTTVEESTHQARPSSSWGCDDGGTTVSEALALCSSFGWRLREEWNLLKRQWYLVLLSVFIIIYGTGFVLLNLAFYRYPVNDAQERLKVDLGHELIPELPLRFVDSGLVEAGMYTFFGVFGVFTICLFINNADAGKRNPKPHLVNILLRLANVYAIGHILRACTYLTTSPPGSADRCLTSFTPNLADYQPKSIAECFYIPGDIYHNCGDLMFSGHMLLMLIMLLGLHRYGKAVFW